MSTKLGKEYYKNLEELQPVRKYIDYDAQQKV